MKKNILLLLVSLQTLGTMAQMNPKRSTYNRSCFWTETVINGKVGGKFYWQLDYQYRRTSEITTVPGHEKSNMFTNPFQVVYRPWIHYQLNDNVRFSLSPFGFWESYFSAGEAGGSNAKIQPEYRICPQLTLTNKIGKLKIDHRYRYEFRFLGEKPDYNGHFFDYYQGTTYHDIDKKGRLRYFLRATMPINKTFYATAWNELFVGIGRNVPSTRIWDQNRTFCLLGYKPQMSFPMRFELGYGFQYANRATTTTNTVERNNILMLYIIFDNFNLLFKKDKKA